MTAADPSTHVEHKMRILSTKQMALLAAVGLSACATSGATARREAAEAQAADDQAQLDLQEHHRHQHRGGLIQFIAMGLDTVGSSEATRAQVDGIQSDMYGCMAPAGAAQQRLRLTVADGVAAGAVDLAAVDVAIGGLDAAAAGVRECSAAALNPLHAVLTPLERAELVEKVRAHWEVWRQVNSEEDSTDRGANVRLIALTRDVSLTPDQVARATASLHVALSGQAGRFDRPGVDANVQEFATAFEGASFDARSITLQANPRLPSYGATRMAIFYETVTPLLTPAQRAALAGQLRTQAGQPRAVTNN